MHDWLVLAVTALLWFVPSPPVEPRMFVGTTPCDQFPRAFLGIPPDASCERISWTVTLAARSNDIKGSFTVRAVYGMQMTNGPGFVDGGKRVAQVDGQWSLGAATTHGATFAAYTLRTGTSEARLARISGSLLHLLAQDDTLAVGNDSWSYTLSQVASAAERPAWTPIEAEQNRASVTEIYVGRSPCQDIAEQLGISTTVECTKLKWRLTLNRDPVTGAPTTYRLENTLFRSSPRTGRWASLRDPQTHQTTYRLDPVADNAFVSLLVGDANVLFFLDRADRLLVGSEDFSYTLNHLEAP